QVRIDCCDVCDRSAGVLGVAAVDRPAESAHQCGNLCPRGELAAGARFDNADALDSADVRDLGPIALAHVLLGVVDPERLDLNDGMTGLGFGLRDFLDFQDVRPSKMLPENCTHDVVLLIHCYPLESSFPG